MVKSKNQEEQEERKVDAFFSVSKTQEKPIPSFSDSIKQFQEMIEGIATTINRVGKALSPLAEGIKRFIAFMESNRENIQQFSKVIARLPEIAKTIQEMHLADNFQEIDESFLEENREEIAELRERYIWGDEGLASRIYEDGFEFHLWISSIIQKIPKKYKNIFGAIVIWYITLIAQAAIKDTRYDPNKLFRQQNSQIKQEIKNIHKMEVNLYISAGRTEKKTMGVVKRPSLSVHKTSRLHSPVIANLPGLARVEALDFKNKKRWVKVRWRDLSGAEKKGWVLGRYLERIQIRIPD